MKRILFYGKNQNFRKVNVQIFNKLLNRTLWETVLRDKGAKKSWNIFKDSFLRTYKLGMARHKKWGKEGMTPARVEEACWSN